MLLVTAAVLAMIAAHALALYYGSAAAAFPTVAAFGVVLVVLKHVGVFGPLYAWFRRRSSHRDR